MRVLSNPRPVGGGLTKGRLKKSANQPSASIARTGTPPAGPHAAAACFKKLIFGVTMAG